MKLVLMGGLILVTAAMAVEEGTVSLDLSASQLLYDAGKPDAMIKNSFETAYIGDGIYNNTGIGQTKEQSVELEETAVYHIKVQNDGGDPRKPKPDNLEVTGPASDSGWEIRYFDGLVGGAEITTKVTTSGWNTGNLDPGETEQIRVEVTPGPQVESGASFTVEVLARSSNQPNRTDLVIAVTTLEGGGGVAEEAAQGFHLDAGSSAASAPLISYGLASTSDVSLSIYDVTGKLVKVLVSGSMPACEHSVQWHGDDRQGAQVPNGVYFCRLEAGERRATRKLVLVR